MTTWWKSARLSLLLALVALPLHATVFSGRVGREQIQLLIRPATSESATSGPITGATLRLPFPTGVLPRPLALRLLTGTRHGNHVVLHEWDSEGHQSATIDARVLRRKQEQHIWYDAGLAGRWKIGGHVTSFKLDFERQDPNIATPRVATDALAEPLHDDLRAQRWSALEFDARLLCAVDAGSCEWIEAVPILRAGGDPSRGSIGFLWDPYVLERAGDVDGAIAAAQDKCERTRRISCFFYADLVPQGLAFTCASALVGCNEYWGEKEIALVEAARRGDTEEARNLLDAGAKATAGGGLLLSALQAAVLSGSEPLVENLVGYGARVDGPAEEALLDPPLLLAIQTGNETIAVFLLDHGATFRNLPHQDGVMLDAALAGQRLVVHKLLTLGVPPDEETAPVGSPLTIAVKNRDLAMIKDLLEHGADPNYENKHSGGSPIDYATRLHEPRALELLLAAARK